MRNQINGIASIAEGRMPEQPLSGACFVSCGKPRTLSKALYWYRDH